MSENLNINTEGQETTTTETQEEKKLTFTQEELDALLQKNGDQRVTQALKKQEKKNAEKVKEAAKLAQMNEEQKYLYELEQREKAIEEKEKELALAENKNAASKILAEKGLSLDLVGFVVADDAETMNSNIKLLEKAFKQSVKNEVEKRLGSTTPKKNLPLDKAITREQFTKMSLSEKQRMAIEQPELFNQLKTR